MGISVAEKLRQSAHCAGGEPRTVKVTASFLFALARELEPHYTEPDPKLHATRSGMEGVGIIGDIRHEVSWHFLSTKDADMLIRDGLYRRGYREARFSLPAIRRPIWRVRVRPWSEVVVTIVSIGLIAE